MVGSHVVPLLFLSAWVERRKSWLFGPIYSTGGFQCPFSYCLSSRINNIFIIQLASAIPLSAKKSVFDLSLFF